MDEETTIEFLSTTVKQEGKLSRDESAKYETAGFVQMLLLIGFFNTVFIIVFCLLIMAVIRTYYKQKLEARLVELQQEMEPERVLVVENANNEVMKIQPPVLSPPISDQTEYNVIAGALREDRKGALF